MRLVYAIDHLGPGGAQRQVVELATCLVRRFGVETSVLVYHPIEFYAERVRDAGLRVELVAKRGRLDAGLPLRLARAHRALAPDLVHAFMPAPALWNLLALRTLPRHRRPVLVAGERTGRLAVRRGKAWAERVAYRGADAVTANASPMLRDLEALGVDAARLHHLPNGIDLEAWDAAAAAECPLELAHGLFHVALVGKLEPQKNHAALFEALARLGPSETAGWRVWCVGGESGGAGFVRGLREQVSRLGLDEVVRFVPPVPQVAALMRGLDALVLPSLWEGFPNVLLEAMASRLPTVASRVGEVGAMMEDGVTGLVVEPGDVDALATALGRLRAASGQERRAWGDAARGVVEADYRVECVAERHLALYRSLL